ncbi:unnamed protein product, partial [Polarella glacialis]
MALLHLPMLPAVVGAILKDCESLRDGPQKPWPLNSCDRQRRRLLPVTHNAKAFPGNVCQRGPSRDYYALAHERMNPLHSELHVQARIGFRRPRQAKVRLRPLALPPLEDGDKLDSRQLKFELKGKLAQHGDKLDFRQQPPLPPQPSCPGSPPGPKFEPIGKRQGSPDIDSRPVTAQYHELREDCLSE